MLTSPPRKPALLVIFLETEICFSHSNRFPCIVITLWPHSIPCTAQLGGNGNSHIWWHKWSQVKGLQSLGIKTIQGFWAATKPDIHQPSCKSSSIECISCISSIFHILNVMNWEKNPCWVVYLILNAVHILPQLKVRQVWSYEECEKLTVAENWTQGPWFELSCTTTELWQPDNNQP